MRSDLISPAGRRALSRVAGRQFTAEVILWAVRWYLMFPVSYRDLELMLQDRGVEVDHTTIFRWIQAYAAELEKTSYPFPARAREARPGLCPGPAKGRAIGTSDGLLHRHPAPFAQ